MTRRLEVDYINASCVEFSGYGSRELHVEVAGRPPVWATRSRKWVTQPSRAADLIALAERKGYDVLVNRRPANGCDPPIAPSARGAAEHDDPGRGLW